MKRKTATKIELGIGVPAYCGTQKIGDLLHCLTPGAARESEHK
jgi:hypothetical protein